MASSWGTVAMFATQWCIAALVHPNSGRMAVAKSGHVGSLVMQSNSRSGLGIGIADEVPNGSRQKRKLTRQGKTEAGNDGAGIDFQGPVALREPINPARRASACQSGR